MVSNGLFVEDNDDDTVMQDTVDAGIADEGHVSNNIAGDVEDDPVLEEYPVYMNGNVGDLLYLFQYPTRSSNKPLVSSRGEGIVEARSKPESGLVEVDIPIDTGRFFDQDKEAEWGQSIARQTMSGVITPEESYLAGVFVDDALHLSKLSGSVQFRPEFKYLSKSRQNGADDRPMNNFSQKEVKAIQMSVKTAESAPRYSNALLAQKNADEEHTIPLQWNDADTPEAWKIAELLITDNKEPLEPELDRDTYLELITDGSATTKAAKDATPQPQVLRSSSKKRPTTKSKRGGSTARSKAK